MKLFQILKILLFVICLAMVTNCDYSKTNELSENKKLDSHEGHDHGEIDEQKDENNESDNHDDDGIDEHSDGTNTENSEEKHENEIVLEQKVIEMIGLKIEKVGEHRLYKEIKLPGEIIPNNDKLQHINPRFAGLVTEVFVSIGDNIKKGQSLAKIQNNETLTNYYVKSLLPGTIINKHITVGEVVNEDSEIFVIADLNDVWVEFDIYSKDMNFIKKGQEILIKAVGLSREIVGTISYVSQVFNTDKRCLTARVVLQNENGNWAPGIFVKGSVNIPSEIFGVAVHNNAIQIVDEKEAIFIPEEKNTFVPIFITTGESDNNYTIITSGISLNEKIVTDGAFELKAKLATSGLGGHAGHGH